MTTPSSFASPPPAGSSRESSIRLDAEGRFWHEGELVTHPGMAKAFASWIALHPDDGRFILTNGYDWTYFSVDDVPYFVRSIRIEGAGARVTLVLSDGSEEPFDAATVVVGERDALYVRVKGGQLEARFMPEAQTALGPLLVENDAGEPVLQLGDRRFPIGARAPRRG